MRYPKALEKVISALMRLPGVGRKTAERYAFHIMGWKSEQLSDLTNALTGSRGIASCSECGCWMEEHCTFCQRDADSLCVLAHAKDVYAIEEMHVFRGRYHVLGGTLSPMEGRYSESLKLQGLLRRLQELGTEEVIIALDATVEGDATALWLKEELKSMDIRCSRLAAGLPMGCTLDYIDGGTLARAFSGRLPF